MASSVSAANESLPPGISMGDLHDAAAVAQRLFERIGPGSISLVAFRCERLIQAGDDDGARFWAEVGRALRRLSPIVRRAETVDGHDVAFTPPPEMESWRPARRIEVFRQRAMEAERKAATGSDAFRAEMLEVVVQWLELARAAQLLAAAEQVTA
jgi:hypothetical protein